jgi:glycosyltransferase involved in cell wall biosynthesis
MIKVLMLGWEFPPHISGGLGTACHGLTTALAKSQVHVLFVVPRLTGAEENNGARLISASAPGNGEIKVSRVTTSNSVVTEEETSGPVSIAHQHISKFEVPSTLSAYNLAHIEEPRYRVSHWNSAMPGERSVVARLEDAGTGYSYTNSYGYQFKGGYGNQLLEEVERYARVIRKIAQDSDFDVIHAHDWMTFPAGIEASRVTGKPLIIHVHATEHDRAGGVGSEIVYGIEKQAIRRSDKIIAVSDWTRKVLIKHYDADASKINVVHNGVQESSSPRLAATVHPLGANMVTFLGRITFQKGPEYFVDAAEKVLKHVPDCHFIMAGSGDALPKIVERVAQKRMSANFHFTGFLNKKQIDEVLSYSRVYVMPSVSEPFGITPLEAIQAGVPVIISNQSGVAEVMPHALKVNFWDTDALSQSICSILRHKSLAHTLKENSRERIRTITWESASKNVKKLYYETIRNN